MSCTARSSQRTLKCSAHSAGHGDAVAFQPCRGLAVEELKARRVGDQRAADPPEAPGDERGKYNETTAIAATTIARATSLRQKRLQHDVASATRWR